VAWRRLENGGAGRIGERHDPHGARCDGDGVQAARAGPPHRPCRHARVLPRRIVLVRSRRDPRVRHARREPVEAAPSSPRRCRSRLRGREPEGLRPRIAATASSPPRRSPPRPRPSSGRSSPPRHRPGDIRAGRACSPAARVRDRRRAHPVREPSPSPTAGPRVDEGALRGAARARREHAARPRKVALGPRERRRRSRHEEPLLLGRVRRYRRLALEFAMLTPLG
jgi:hypothetical protein